MLKKLVLVFLVFPLLAFAKSGGPGEPSSIGLHLLHTFWKDIEAKNVSAISGYMSSQFQGLYNSTAADKYRGLQIVQSSPVVHYVFTNIQETRRNISEGSFLTLTYVANYDATSKGVELDQPFIEKGYYYDLLCSSSWLQIGQDDWRLMSHSIQPIHVP